MLVDCGEGAQLSLRRQRLKFSRLTDVFISHLHGDHFLGLPGLLSTLSLHEKGGKVRVHIFEAGARLMKTVLDAVCHETSFEVEYDIIPPEGGVLLHEHGLKVTAFPLYHRVPCVGFRFDEDPKPRHLRGDMAKFYNIPVFMLPRIKNGEDFVTDDGRVIANERLTTDADPSASYAYCSDTMYDERVAQAVQGVDVLYHEATYASDNAHLARERGHSTAADAAHIAAAAGASRLIIGHYSKRYNDPDLHLADARAIFPATDAADEGMRINLD